jgi:hypothetical protein
MHVPSWDELRRHMVDVRRPPLTARVVMREREEVEREARVVWDGAEMWSIDDGSRLELSAGRTSVFVSADGVRAIREHHAHANSWVKSMFEARLIAYLAEATCVRIDAGVIRERSCWVAEVEGLRRDENAVFRLCVDRETGIVLELERIDVPGTTVSVLDLRAGTLGR